VAGSDCAGFLVWRGLLFLQNWNDWPIWSASYNTNASTVVPTGKIGQWHWCFALVTAITVTLVVAGGRKRLYRLRRPQRLQLFESVRAGILRGRRNFFGGRWGGLSLAGSTHCLRGGFSGGGPYLERGPQPPQEN